MLTATSSAQARLRRVPLTLIDALESRRSLDEEHVARLEESIGRYGLLQPLVVIERGERYLLAGGGHRFAALLRRGELEADATVLPAGTTLADAKACSLHENHVRKDESLPDVTRRVTDLMQAHGCTSLAEGCLLAGIHKSTASKLRTTLGRLAPKALALVAEGKVGVGVAYEIARRASGPEEQVEWLQAHRRGELNRDGIVARSQRIAAEKRAARRVRPSSRKPRALRLRGTVEGIGLAVTVPAGADMTRVVHALVTVARTAAEHAKSARVVAEFKIG